MNSADISNTIIIIIIFAIINVVSVLGIGIDHIKNNWNEYKCMPVVIPFANILGPDGTTTQDTFNNCVQGVLGNFMSDLLAPIYKIFQQISAITEEIGKFMSMFNNIGNLFKFNFLDMLTNVYQLGTKLLLGLTQFAIKLQDMINKVLGIFLTIIYVFLGANYTVISIWNGLPGQLVREVTKIAGAL